MEIRFSDDFNAVLAFSREEALRTGSYGIGPDHLLLGILRHANNSACTILSDMGVELERLKTLIDGKIITNEEISYSDLEKITLSRVGQNILSLALIETRRNDCSTAIPIHLLLALSLFLFGHLLLELHHALPADFCEFIVSHFWSPFCFVRYSLVLCKARNFLDCFFL